jgi:hypothetical protein
MKLSLCWQTILPEFLSSKSPTRADCERSLLIGNNEDIESLLNLGRHPLRPVPTKAVNELKEAYHHLNERRKKVLTREI